MRTFIDFYAHQRELIVHHLFDERRELLPSALLRRPKGLINLIAYRLYSLQTGPHLLAWEDKPTALYPRGHARV